MAIESQNIYKNARKSAGFTQEKASQLLNVSVDSLRDYEQSQRPVPSDVASAMCDVYQAPYLAVQHLRLTSDLGKRVVPEIQLKDLPEAVLGVLAAVQRFCAKREAMVEIAADGQIAESEQAEWDEIMCLANDLNVAMDKQKIKSVPRLTTDNPVDNFQTALNFTDVSEDGWVWLRQPEMALTEYARQLVKGHGSSIDLGCNDMELSESLTDHLFDDPKQSIDGLIAEHYTILWAYATLREKLKWYEDAGIPVIPNYGLSTIRRAINRYGTAPQLQMAIKEMSELTKAICNLQRAVTFNYRNGAKIKVAHESVREEIADVYIMLAQLVEIVGKPEEVQQIVLEKLEQLKGDLDGGEVQSE